MSTEQALAQSVIALDASRRVGWAKHFATAERNDELSHDLNLAQTDAKILASHLALIYGFLEIVEPKAAGFLKRNGVNVYAIKSFLPQEAMTSGRKLGSRLRRSRR